MSNSLFNNVNDVVKLGGDNYGHALANQFGSGGEASNLGSPTGLDAFAATLGGDVGQTSKQLTTGGTVGDTETNNSSVVVLNIT